MIRTLTMLVFWVLAAPVAALIGFPWTMITRDVSLLYRLFMFGAWNGVRLTGVRVRTVGLDKLDPARTYIFMSNHVSNLDPPITIPLIPRRTSVMVKKELFTYPILGRAMRMGSLVPVDRGNRDAGIESVRVSKQVVQHGLNMTIYVEGHRSFDGKLLPFKKGPFYLAMECGVPVVPVTIAGTHYVMPKGRFAIKPGVVTVTFHAPIEPKDFGSRECLMEKVRTVIDSGLLGEYRQELINQPSTCSGQGPDTNVHEGNISLDSPADLHN
jgi:1-acyl-sn-glycerol-3-phosphate acyltransferase